MNSIHIKHDRPELMADPFRAILVTDATIARAVVFPRPRASRAVVVRNIKRRIRKASWGILALAFGLAAVWLAFAVPDWGLL